MSASAIPECQVLMLRLKDDLLVLLKAAVDGQLGAYVGALARRCGADRGDGGATAIPGAEEGQPIDSRARQRPRARASQIFHAGTALKDGELVANGGRVLNVTALGQTVGRGAGRAPMRAVDRIDWPDGFCRRDIGWRAVVLEKRLPLKG